MLAKILIPETEKPATAGNVKVEVEKPGVNIIDAAARGAGDGLHLALNIGGMLIAFLALIALVNGMLGLAARLPGSAGCRGRCRGFSAWFSRRLRGCWACAGTTAPRSATCSARGWC